MKKVLSVVLVIALLFSLSTSAFAMSTYTVPAGTAVLEQVPMEYDVLVIPGDVLVIADASESYNQYPLKYVSIGEGVQYIGAYSFSGAQIKTVTIPNSVTHIGANAFPSVTKVVLKSGAAKALFSHECQIMFYEAFPMAQTLVIEAAHSDFTSEELICIENWFLSCNAGATVVFNDKTVVSNNYLAAGSTEIPYGAYHGSTYESVILPDSMRVIGDEAFYNSTISYIDLAKTESIGNRAFSGCSDLTSVEIPATVKTIGENAFSTVKTVTFQSGNSFSEIFYGENTEASFSLAFPQVSTVYINTDMYSVELYKITDNPSVQTIIFSDGYVWQRGVFSLPDGITEIYEHDISGNCPASVILPDSVKIIHNYAFRDTAIKYIDLAKVESIGSEAFVGCSDLTSVEIPSTVKTIGENAFSTVKTVTFESGNSFSEIFYGENTEASFSLAFPQVSTVYINTDMYSVELYKITDNPSVQTIIFSDGYVWQRGVFSLPDGITEIYEYDISGNCPASVILPDSVRIIHDYAFRDTAIKYIDLAKAESIGCEAFVGCSDLTSVEIPSTVKTIGENAFSTVKTVTFETGNSFSEIFYGENTEASFSLAFPQVSTVYINTDASSVVPSFIAQNESVQTIIYSDGSVWQRGKLFFPSGCAEIEPYAYSGWSLESIVIPDSISIIGCGAFSGASFDGAVVLGENVTEIHSEAFRNTKLSSVVFGSAPVSIYDNAFADTALTSVKIPANVVSLGENAFATDSLKSVVIDASVLSGALKGKSVADVFGTVDNIIVEGDLTEIPPSMFFGTAAKNITYSDKVVSIGSNAFKNCSITEAKIGGSVLNIGERAYRYARITALNIPDNVVNIGKEAFSVCQSLEFANIGSGISEISEGMFMDCSALKIAILPETITKIGDNAFNSCSSLENINIPLTVTEIGANAFEGCVALKSVVIPNGVTTIKAGAFKNCTGLVELSIPESVTTIEEGAFEGCTGLEGVVIPENVSQIQNAAFKNCVSLDTIVVPETVSAIDEEAFEGCENLTLAGCSGSAVATYASANNVPFCAVNAYPIEGTAFDFENGVIYTENATCDNVSEIVKSSSGAEIVYSDKFCGTGSTITIVKDDDVQTFILVVDGDLNGDSACDVLDAALAASFSSEKDTPDLAQIYAAGGKDAETISVNEYSSMVNKIVF